MILPESAIVTIETWRLGFVATAKKDGTPNLSPKGTFIVVDEETIAFGEMRSPNTVQNLRENPELEINFVDILTRRGVRVRGNATIAEHGTATFLKLYPSFEEIWGAELCDMFNAIVVIPVEIAKPLQSPIYELDGNPQDLKSLWKQKISEM